MSRPAMGPKYAAALAGAGFRRCAPACGKAPGADVYRRPAPGRWVLEARQEGGRNGHVDVGLTLDSGGGALIGPVHRALTPAALASALPHITASLEALAGAADSLRCPDCSSFEVLVEGNDGPVLACGQARKGRRPFDRTVRRCRRDLVMAGLVVYREPGEVGG